MKIRMKRYIKRIIPVILLLGGLLACSGDVDTDQGGVLQPDDPGKAIQLSFKLYDVEVTRADVPSTTLEEGVKLRIYAYSKGADTSTAAPLAEGVYTVGQNGVATGSLYLYRGEYDLYLVSYNSSIETPVLNEMTHRIDVNNGLDFMHAELKGIVVQPTTIGTYQMEVALPEAFKRMATNLTVKVKAAGTQPISINELKLNTFHIDGLSSSCEYQLGSAVWGTATPMVDEQYQVLSISGNPGAYSEGYTSAPFIIFPVNDNSRLNFTINLSVKYSGNKELNKDYKASIRKALLPGMKYTLEFILTFYGEIVSTDLTLKLYDYNGVELSTDSMGTD